MVASGDSSVPPYSYNVLFGWCIAATGFLETSQLTSICVVKMTHLYNTNRGVDHTPPYHWIWAKPKVFDRWNRRFHRSRFVISKMSRIEKGVVSEKSRSSGANFLLISYSPTAIRYSPSGTHLFCLHPKAENKTSKSSSFV